MKTFSLENIKFKEGSMLHHRMKMNEKYLLSLDIDRLLYTTRETCGVDTKGAQPYGGWESPQGGVRGQFIGHYIKACINMYQYYGRDEAALKFKERVVEVIDALRVCQLAYGNGYLNAIPEAQFDLLELRQNPYEGGVPYYVTHKMFFGTLEAFKAFQLDSAKAIADEMAEYYLKRLAKFTDHEIEEMMNTKRYPTEFFKEFGGMYDVALSWFEVTQDEKYLKLSKYFDRKWFNEMLFKDKDLLAINKEHVNSEIPVVLGMVKHYEYFKDDYYKTGVENFMKWMREGHVFPSGGLSGASAYKDYGSELYQYPNMFYDHITTNKGHKGNHSGESCCAHNMNAIDQHVFMWDQNVIYMHEFENRFVNCVLSQQHPETGMFIYNQDLKFGSFKEWGDEEDAFWCCYCTGVEAFSSLQEGAFYHHNNELYITNYMECELTWQQKVINVTTDFPKTGLGWIDIGTDENINIHLRIPKWAGKQSKVLLNDKALAVVPGEFLVVECQDKDRIQFDFSYELQVEEMPDRPEYIAVKFGPHLLVPCTHESVVFTGTKDDLLLSLKSNGVANQFRVKISPDESADFAIFTSKKHVIYKPIGNVVDELYNGYTKVTEPREVVLEDEILIDKYLEQRLIDHEKTKIMNGGLTAEWLMFEIQIHPKKINYLHLWFDGNETSFEENHQHIMRLFDIEIIENDELIATIATQTLLAESPDEVYDVIYPIPLKYTEGKSYLTIRLRKKDFYDFKTDIHYKGIVGSLLDKVQIHTYKG